MAERQSDIDLVFIDQFDVLAEHGTIIEEDLQRSGQTLENYKDRFAELAAMTDLGHVPFEVYQQAYNEFMGLPPDACMVSRLKPIEPMHELAAALRANGIPHAILSNVGRGVFKLMHMRQQAGGPAVTLNLPKQYIVQSCEVGLRKPDPRMWQYAANAAFLLAGVKNPTRILAIDDQASNIEGALDYGLSAIQCDTANPELTAQAVAARLGIDLASHISPVR